MENYADLLFTPDVRAEQDRAGMGERYAQVYSKRHRDPLDEDTKAFIETRDSFYMASIATTGWPYVQHRGGKPGFVRVIGPERIAFLDYPGNKQFITKGNLKSETRVALFFMDYARRARLKLLGHARMVDAAEESELVAELARPGDPDPERVAVIDLAAMDWNCPKYITPRLTEAEIEASLGPRISQMGARIQMLERRLDAVDPGWRSAN